jgi:hypothetical protein
MTCIITYMYIDRYLDYVTIEIQEEAAAAAVFMPTRRNKHDIVYSNYDFEIAEKLGRFAFQHLALH